MPHLSANPRPATTPSHEDIVAIFRRLKERLEASRPTVTPLPPHAEPHLRLVVDNDRTVTAAAT